MSDEKVIDSEMRVQLHRLVDEALERGFRIGRLRGRLDGVVVLVCVIAIFKAWLFVTR